MFFTPENTLKLNYSGRETRLFFERVCERALSAEEEVHCCARDLAPRTKASSARTDLRGRQGSSARAYICNVETVDQLTNYTSLLPPSLSFFFSSCSLPLPLSPLSLPLSLYPFPECISGNRHTQRHAHST